MCCFKKKRNGLMGKVVNYDFVLRINTRFDLPQEIVEDTIIHEMIHYYIASNQLKDTSAHGQLFRTMMNGINARFGRHIAISHKPTETQKQQAREGRRSWHVVAVVTFTDGRTGVKVLPRIVERITYYYNKVLSAKDVSAIQLYMSNDTWMMFSSTSFPTPLHSRSRYAKKKRLRVISPMRNAWNATAKE